MDAESTKRRFRVHGWTILWAAAILWAVVLLNVVHRGWPFRFSREVEVLPERLVFDLLLLGGLVGLSVCFVESMCRRLAFPPRKADYVGVMLILPTGLILVADRIVLLGLANILVLFAVSFCWLMVARFASAIKLRRSESTSTPEHTGDLPRPYTMLGQFGLLVLVLLGWSISSGIRFETKHLNPNSDSHFGWPIAFVADDESYVIQEGDKETEVLNLFRRENIQIDILALVLNVILWAAAGVGWLRWGACLSLSIRSRMGLAQVFAVIGFCTCIFQIVVHQSFSQLADMVVALAVSVFLIGISALVAGCIRDCSGITRASVNQHEPVVRRRLPLVRAVVVALLLPIVFLLLSQREKRLVEDGWRVDKAASRRFGEWLDSVGPRVRPLDSRGNQIYFQAGTDSIREVRGISLKDVTVEDLSPLQELFNLRTIRAKNCSFQDLTDLAVFPNLSDVRLEGCTVQHWSSLAKLTAVNWLDLTGADIKDLRPIAKLPALEVLVIDKTSIEDLTPLVGNTTLYSLAMNETKVRDLSPLGGLMSLELLSMKGAPVKNIGPLSGLGLLGSLDIGDTRVTDLSPLRTTNLFDLNIRGTPVQSLRGLEKLPRLIMLTADESSLRSLNHLPSSVTNLSLVGVKMPDYSTLKRSVGLESLNLDKTSIRDLSCLANLTQLTHLQLADTPVSDLAPLKGVKRLHLLDLRGTAVEDVTPLTGMVDLWDLKLARAKVRDVSALGKLKLLDHLDLGKTQVESVDRLRTIKTLATLKLNETLVRDISSLAVLEDLAELDLSGTLVTDVKPLSDMYSLQSLNLSSTAVSDVAPLAGLTTLNWLDLSGTKIRSITVLDDLYNLRELRLKGVAIARDELTWFQKGLPNCNIVR